MKNTAITVILISALFLSAVAGTSFINLGKANPYLHRNVYEEVPPPNGTKPATISIFSPENNTAYASNNISLTFNITNGELNNISLAFSEIYYEASWINNPIAGSIKTYLNFAPMLSINLTGVPEGPHWVTVSATATNVANQKQYPVPQGALVRYHHVATYHLATQSTAFFTIDSVAPNVSILISQNKTYSSSDVLLDFAVNEKFSQVAYSLDCGNNVTVAGNSTLSGLSVGEHNVTVYTWDVAGNIGASETITFTVAEPFPTVPVTAASLTTIAVAGLGLLVYLRKRLRQK